ncbi:MAG: hypothetical protein LBG83_01855 [Oscillospiraceae bacterium]|jgi:tetratricopeptide (TPR) repeat protein|nr:hypothetical protein [Oscillospiraceae bacterium]
MKNPYEVLHLPQGADEATVREQYRRLLREYEGSPRRVEELNDAYDSIVLARGAGRGSYENSDGGWRTAPEFSDIRRQLSAGRYDDALTLLDGIAAAQRGAEWYYLKGCAQRGRGWLEEAERNFAQAARLAPGNGEYRAAYDQMRGNRQGGYRERRRNDDDGSGCCKICLGLWCADQCCDCFGGDLIPCC